jgi:hypothetical protein
LAEVAHCAFSGPYDGQHSQFDGEADQAQQDVGTTPGRSVEVEQALDQAQRMLDVALSTYRTRLDHPSPAAKFYSSEEKLEPIVQWFIRRSRDRPVRLSTVWSGRPKLETHPALLRQLCLRSTGSTVRALSPPEAVVVPESDGGIAGLDTRHAEIRVCQWKLPDLTIMDGQVAIMRATTSYGQPRIFVVDSPEIVHGFRALYDVVWAEAVELRKFRPRGVAPDEQLTAKVLALLGDGCKDEAAARQLGLSVRTYRRHVADLMTRLHVTCRFQAGVQAVRMGLIGDGPAAVRSGQPHPGPMTA